MVDIAKTGNTRVFLIEDRAAPDHAPVYQALAKAGQKNWPQGDVSPIRVASRTQYSKYDNVDEVLGEQGLPELGVTFREQLARSEIFRIVRKRCPLDLQVHYGSCTEPTDFQSFEKVLVLEGARPSNYGSGGDIGSFDSSEEAAIDEVVPFTGIDMYEVKPLAPTSLGSAEIVQEVVAVAICDSPSCGSCGRSSDGVQRFFALTVSAGGSPGLPAELIYTNDGGATLGETNISTLPANEDPDGMACVGTRLVVISQASESLHWALIAEIIAGTESWQEVATGFVAAKGPLAVFSLGATFTWMAAEGGYIYFSDDVTTGVDVQTAGSITTENLNDIHGVDELNLVAVGNANVVLVTSDGGSTWSAITGPDAGVALNCVFMKSKTVWLVGTAGGKLWGTSDGGDTWTEVTFSGSGAGVVRDIEFATPTVGYMAHDTATPRGRIFRTIDGGHSWYALPESTGLSMPLQDRFNSLAATSAEPNFVIGGGLADNATDGILVKCA